MNKNIKNKLSKILSKKEGKLLSEESEYKNQNSKLNFECKNGHIFTSDWCHVQQNKWCPYCAGRYRTIEEVREFAISRGGKCLSSNYISSISPLLWQCSAGHQWSTSFNKVKNGERWCPYCNTKTGEKICRLYFEEIFNKKFIKLFPPWLLNDDGNKLELDGYCEELNLAFEYNGQHHYENNCYGVKTDLKKIQNHDEIKIDKCAKRNIKLIVIPHAPQYENIKEYIKNYLIINLPKYGFDISSDLISKININDNQVYIQEYLNEMHDIAKKNNGKCLSDQYHGSNVKLKWECQLGHIWFDSPLLIKNKNRWCPYCTDPFKMDTETLMFHLNEFIAKEKDIFNQNIYKAIFKKINLLERNNVK